MSSRTRTQLEDWIKTKELSGKILDVGGSQLSIRNRAWIEDGTEILVLDLPQPHQGDTPDIIQDLNVPVAESMGGVFDFAVCLEVSEYWYDPVTALKNINYFLKSGGTLHISFHFIYPVHNPVEQDYLRYTRAGALKLLDIAGFEVREVVTRLGLYENFRNFFWTERMRPAKGYQHHEEVGLLVTAIKK